MTLPLNHVDTVKALDKTVETALIRLVYVSSLTLSSRLKATIFEEVENHARQYNEQNGITGTLCYGNRHFLQCLEGEKAKVLALQKRIFADKRHKNIKILLLQTISQRTFIDWRMRLLFLERWVWSPATKRQATQLSSFLPFTPHKWQPEETQKFIDIIKTFETSPHVNVAGMTYNAMGNMIKHVAAPHQAFLLVQGLLAVLLVVGLVLLNYSM